MLRFALVPIFITLHVISTFGQSDSLPEPQGPSEKMLIGIEGGPSRVFLFGTYPDKGNGYSQSLGFLIGASFQYNFYNISLYTSILYERKGASEEVTISNKRGFVTGFSNIYYIYDYITVPILAKFSHGNKVKLIFNVGPYFGYLLNQRTDYSEMPFEYENQSFFGLKALDIGFTAGIGSDIRLSEKYQLSVELRNNMGLLNSNTNTFPGGDGTIHTNSTNIVVGFAYRIGVSKEDEIPNMNEMERVE